MSTPQNTIIHPQVKTYPAKKGGVKPSYKRRNTGKGMTGYKYGDTASFSVWLNLPIGAYAIAHRWPGTWDIEKDPCDIMVRARKKVYLDRLRKTFLPELGPDVGRDGKGTDYGHRSYCTADQLAKAMARMALAIDSPSFKDHCLDNDLHDAYMSMWSSLVKLDDQSPYNHKGTGYKWGTTGGGWWQKPNQNHRPKPSDCMRMGYHWFDAKDGNATCVDCGAQRTAIAGKGGKTQFRYTYPPGAVVLHTQNGKVLDKNQVRRIPGGTVPFDGPALPSYNPLKKEEGGQVGYGLGYPSLAPDKKLTSGQMAKVLGTGTIAAEGDPAAEGEGGADECLQFSEHWWTGPGTAICRDCGAGRYLDEESGQWRFTHPVGSAMLTDADGEPIEDPHIVTDEDAPDEGEPEVWVAS